MECQKPLYLHKIDMVVPCGRCAFCSATRRSDWTVRLHYESRCHFQKRFLTLTYAEPHLIWAHGNSQLHKPHVQEFFKTLRNTGCKVRYYAVGEYGSRTYRPHYHIILFGSTTDEDIRASWRYGHVHIGSVTDHSIAYTLGYLVNAKSFQFTHNRVRPFSMMSLKPALGSNYLSQEMIDWHRSQRKNYVIIDGVKKHLPRYYKSKIFSKIDHVRIAVRDQKDLFKRQVKWLRSHSISRMRDPSAYRKVQMDMLAKKIRAHSKMSHQI